MLGSSAVARWGARRRGIHHLADGLVARRSPSEGFGLVATRPFTRGTLLCVWGGRVVDTASMLALPKAMRRYALQIDDAHFLVTPLLGVGAADLVNHSCDPTALLVGADTLVARRRIRPGDEITYDYATSDANSWSGFLCRCGTELCRGKVTQDDWRDPALHARYGAAFSPYLLRRIRELDAGRRDASTMRVG